MYMLQVLASIISVGMVRGPGQVAYAHQDVVPIIPGCGSQFLVQK